MTNLFDGNCAIGMVARPGPAGAFRTPAELIEYQARFGIDRALAFHSLALEEHPVSGNKALIEAIGGLPNLFPSWVILPHHTGEFPPPEELLVEARESGVRALRMFPDIHKYPVDDWVLGDLLAAVEGQVPLFWHIKFLDTPTARDIYGVCSSYPRLQVVVCDVDKSINRVITPLMRRLPNLWLETSGYRVHHSIKYICEAVGDDRVIFGTQLPWQSAGGPHADFAYAEITEESRARIGSENLERLLATAAW